jgi:hypothetical protein
MSAAAAKPEVSPAADAPWQPRVNPWWIALAVMLATSRDAKFQRVRLRIKNDTEAINLVDSVDEERAEFIQHYFKVQWPSRHLYHAMLNTDAGVEETVNTILYLMDAANKKAGGDQT